jgi:hypothetical protein
VREIVSDASGDFSSIRFAYSNDSGFAPQKGRNA